MGRKICLALSIGAIGLWLLTLAPLILPHPIQPYHAFIRGALTLGLIPALVAVRLCTANRFVGRNASGALGCSIVAFGAYRFFATSCAVGCESDLSSWAAMLVALASGFGAIYFLTRLSVWLLQQGKGNALRIVSRENAA
jgi:hypothetical protein